jgi:tRNA-dependent cyclodipeptide synthase
MRMRTDYRAKIVRAGRWRQFDRCSLTVSMESAAHEGEKLLAAVEFVNARRLRFSACHVFVCDALHRHNLLGPEGAAGVEEAHARARRLGDEWLRRNRQVLDRLSIPLSVSRWDQYLTHPEHSDRRSAVGRLNDTSAAFATAVASDVTRYARRHSTPTDRHFREAQGVAYVLEEIAVLSLKCREVTAAEIYPGRELDSLRYLREHAPGGIPTELHSRSFTQLDIVRRKPEEGVKERGE